MAKLFDPRDHAARTIVADDNHHLVVVPRANNEAAGAKNGGWIRSTWKKIRVEGGRKTDRGRVGWKFV